MCHAFGIAAIGPGDIGAGRGQSAHHRRADAAQREDETVDLMAVAVGLEQQRIERDRQRERQRGRGWSWRRFQPLYGIDRTAVDAHLVAYDTKAVDLSPWVADPFEVLLRTQLGGGTDISGAVGYCQGLNFLAAMLLRHSLGLAHEAAHIEQAVGKALDGGARTADIGGSMSTRQMADAILKHL